MTTETAITVIVPKDINEATSLAQKLSKSNLLPDALRGKEPDILMTIMTGAELGLAPMQSIRAIDVIKGKPTLKAEAMVALVRRRRDVCEYFNIVHSDDKRCSIEAKRVGGAPIKLSFTIEDAQRAGLLSNDNWKRFPAAMLRARCSSAVCKAEFSDLILGLYDPDELRAESTPAERVIAQTIEVTPAQHAPKPTPPAVEALPSGDAVAEVLASIEAATTTEALNGLVSRIQRLGDTDKARVRVKWGERRDALTRAAVPFATEEVTP